MSQLRLSKRISNNKHFIAEKTTNLTALLNLLEQHYILTSIETSEIRAKATDYDKCTYLYESLKKKNDTVLSTIIECLRTSGNDFVASKLEFSDLEEKNQPIWFNIGERIPQEFYFGREIELQKLNEIWDKCYSKNLLQFVSITGLAGVGKTELATNFAVKFHNEEKGHCVFINAGTTFTALESLRRLSFALGISENDFEKEENFTKKFTKVYEKLSKAKCLIIFDNLENCNTDIISAFREIENHHSPSSLKPLFLLTSRDQRVNEVARYEMECIKLHILTDNLAEKYLVTRLNVEINDGKLMGLIKKLVAKLQGHPLALHQAASYFINKKRNYSLEDAILKYLDDIENPILTFERENSPADKSVFKTIYVSLEKIRKTAGQDANLLSNFIGFLSPDRIPVKLLKGIMKKFKKSNEDIGDSIFILLSDNSLCTFKDGKISIHRLVQEAIRYNLQRKNQTLSVLNGLVDTLKEMLKSKEVSLEEIIFVEAVWSHMKNLKDLVIKHPEFADDIHYFYYKGGRYQEAHEFCSDASKCLETQLGSKNKWTLKINFWRAYYLENKAALDLLKEVYNTQKMEFGDDEKDCLYTARKIATLYKAQKKFGDMVQWLQKALSHKKFVEENDNALTYIEIDIASYYSAKGMDEKALETLTRILTHEKANISDPVYQRARFSLADVLCRQKKYYLSLEEILRLLEIQKQCLKQDHPQILRSETMLCTIYEKLGRFSECQELAKEIYDKSLKSLGADHWNTKKIKNKLENLPSIQ